MLTTDLIYDWNQLKPNRFERDRRITFNDETLRDGLQSPSVTDPPIGKKIELLYLMEELGIDTLDIGLPGAGGKHAADVEPLAREIVDQKLRIRPNCAARTKIEDITPIIEISKRVGIPIEVCTFIPSSSIRMYVDPKTTLDELLRRTEEAVTCGQKAGLPVMYVTEDTTRANPDTLTQLYTTAIRCGANAICVCDTVGHATPDGVREVVSFVRQIIEQEAELVRLDWHGHQDRGLGVINSIAAIEAGADQVHGSALGMGERVGNTPMDQLLVNLRLMGWIDNDLTRLVEYCEVAALACNWKIPCNYPVFGSDAFRTATGVHADAVIKAYETGNEAIADLVYSGVPAGQFGLRQKIEISSMSGNSNVVYYLKLRNIEPTDDRVERIREYAKKSSTVLTEEEVMKLV
jgi:isopropylmalate/homocitrate/citramalate synthase